MWGLDLVRHGSGVNKPAQHRESMCVCVHAPSRLPLGSQNPTANPRSPAGIRTSPKVLMSNTIPPHS